MPFLMRSLEMWVFVGICTMVFGVECYVGLSGKYAFIFLLDGCAGMVSKLLNWGAVWD